jgi:pimeloyl-ACP methyl ester carboxylesterase
MSERTVKANGIEIWTESFGRPSDPTLLLVMGAGGQGILWPEEFCQALATGGTHVIRYDNRDTGQSTCFDFAKQPYTLSDMARDAVGVLDAYGVERAHVAGASMGGMIAQVLALEHAARLRTVTIIMSSPLSASINAIFSGASKILPPPHEKVLAVAAAMATKPPQTREERIDAGVAMWRALAGSGEPFDEAAVRARELRIQTRARNIDAANNHQLAIAASPDRTEALAGVRLPALVIHGAEDPILPLAHGEAVAKRIPGAELLVIPGMGHDLPPRAVKRVEQAILAHMRGR